MKNKWKISFYVLLGLIILITSLIVYLVFSPADNDELKKSKNNVTNEDVAFQVRTNKNDLNRVIAHYIEEENKSSIDYNVVLTDEVEVYGTIPLFSQDLELKLTFEPKALENGDLVLKQKSISLGKLRLPVEVVLKLVRDSYDLPEAVHIQPKEEQVYVSMENLKLKSDIKVRMNDFDLKKDLIRFTLFVPAD